MTVLAIATPHMTELDEISVEIGREHRLVAESRRQSLEHSIFCGELLLQAKEMIPHGHWDEWLSEKALEWNMTLDWARRYMRFARFKDSLRANEITTAKAASAFMRRAVVADVRVDPTKRMECKRLRSEGRTTYEIADELGISQATAWRWLNPDREEHYRRQAAKTSRAGRAALRKNERAAAAKRVGGDLGKSYSTLRLLIEQLQHALDEHTGETKREIGSAMNSLYNAEDAIGRALKIADRPA